MTQSPADPVTPIDATSTLPNGHPLEEYAAESDPAEVGPNAASPTDQTPPPSTPVTNPESTATQTTLSTVSQSTGLDAAAYEARVRHFQGEADRAKREAEEHARRAEEAQKAYEAVSGNQKAIIDGASKAAAEALQKAQDIARELEEERAQRIRAEAIAERPHLKAYLRFIPANSDSAKIREQLDALEQIRNSDLEAHKAKVEAELKAQQPATPPATTPVPAPNLPYPPGSNAGAFNPATPAPGASTASSASSAEAIRQALEAAWASGDQGRIAQVMAEQIKVAEALGRAQFGVTG